MEMTISSMNILVSKPCLICGATVKVPALCSDDPAICSECYQAIAWAKEKMKEKEDVQRD